MNSLKNIVGVSILMASMNAAADLVVLDTVGREAKSPHGEMARYKAGQVVVKGTPEDYSDYEVIKVLPNAGLLIIKVEPGKELAQVKRFKEKNKKSSLNFIAHQFATVSDNYFYPYQWNFTAVQAEQAWDLSIGSGVKVAVLDTGLKTGGVDGVNICAQPGIDIVNADSDPADGNGHGTHVSGTIAQQTNNYGTAGLAYGACILPVKVLNDSGSGTDADIAEGIAWAVNNGARVINMSLGYPAGNALSLFVGSPSYNALNAASNQVTIVVASGNDGATSGVSYPASHPETIAVGATGYSSAFSLPSIAPYSNQGSDLDLVAPGGNLNVDLNGDGYGDGILQETYASVGWAHYFFQGTSMASPHVAAAAAMLIAQDQTLNRYDVLTKLSDSALDLGAAGKDSVFGHGLIQVYDALMLSPPAVNQAPVSSFTYSCNDLLCDFSSTAQDEDGSISVTHWTLSDGSSSYDSAFQHEFSSPGSYVVTLTVADNEGLENASSQTIEVTAPPVNQVPVAAFSYSCVDLDCSFSSVSSDIDGVIVSYDWDFGDGNAYQNSSSVLDYSYAQEGSYLVTLTVTDDAGTEASVSQVVTVNAPQPAPVPFIEPSNVSAVDNADGSASLSWTDENADTLGFEIQRRKLNVRRGTWGSWATIVTNVSALSYNDASGKGVFQYQVKAFNDNEMSGWSLSNEVTVTNTTKGGGGSKGGGRNKK